MIIFKAFQGLENFYIKFKDFPNFSSICTNPAYGRSLQWDTFNRKKTNLLNNNERYFYTKIIHVNFTVLSKSHCPLLKHVIVSTYISNQS